MLTPFGVQAGSGENTTTKSGDYRHTADHRPTEENAGRQKLGDASERHCKELCDMRAASYNQLHAPTNAVNNRRLIRPQLIVSSRRYAWVPTTGFKRVSTLLPLYAVHAC